MTARHRQLVWAVCLAAIFAPARPARANDLWLVPRTPVVRTLGEARAIPVSLFIGAMLTADVERTFASAETARLMVVHGTSSRDLQRRATEGARPLVRVELDSEGGHLVVLDRTPERFDLAPQDFSWYAGNQGFVDVLDDRKRRGESSRPARERETRYLKALVQVGASRDETFGAEVGQTLELIPERDPVQASPGSSLPVRVKLRGEPLSGAKLWALSRVGDSILASPYATDARGVASIPIDRRGIWLLRMGHMSRCDGCADADWETFWASYVFATGEPGGGTVVAPEMLAAPAPAKPPRSALDFAVGGAIVGGGWVVVVGASLLWQRVRRRGGP